MAPCGSIFTADRYKMTPVLNVCQAGTTQILVPNAASRCIVELADIHAPGRIRLQNRCHYRETTNNPVHDIAFADIRTKSRPGPPKP